jgi:hypothetical protein
MPNLPAALVQLAEELRLHRHFLRELRNTAGNPAFPGLPAEAQDSHRAFIRAHEDAARRLFQETPFPEPALIEALADRLDRDREPSPQHPTARHLGCIKRVLAQRDPIDLILDSREDWSG